MKPFLVFLSLLLLLTPHALAESSLLKYARRNAPPPVALTLFPERTPEPGQAVRVVAQLSKDGKPLTEDMLKATVHGEKIHLLVVDSMLSDYQHLHPEPAPTPGSYVFTFIPKQEGGYRVWADITLLDTGEKQLASADLGNFVAAKISILPSDTVISNGYAFSLSLDDTPRAEESVMGTLRVTDEKGQPVTSLEPVMGAFGHVVGFHDDYAIVLSQPVGKDPRSDVERGGPTVTFYLLPGKPGLMRVFAQVRINGQDIYAPFGIKVEKPALTE